MNIDDFEKLVEQRQSCRSFDGTRKIDPKIIERIMDIALLSPSACNSQPWNFIVVQGEQVARVAKYTQGYSLNKFSENCSAFVIVMEDRPAIMERFAERFRERDFISNDIGIAAAHLVLAAQSAGIGSCILGIFNEEKIKELLNIAPQLRIKLVIALGYATKDYEVRAKDRKKDKPVDYIG